MTAVDPIEPASPLSATQQAVLLSALVFVAIMVIGVCLVVGVGVGAASRPTVSRGPEMTASCRAALERARAADRGGSSAEAIKAAKQMLEICRT